MAEARLVSTLRLRRLVGRVEGDDGEDDTLRRAGPPRRLPVDFAEAGDVNIPNVEPMVSVSTRMARTNC